MEMEMESTELEMEMEGTEIKEQQRKHGEKTRGKK